MIRSVIFQDHFDAAHHLPNHPGKCRNLHGHRWVVRVEVVGIVNDVTGMVADFSDLKQILRQLTEQLDHCIVNGAADTVVLYGHLLKNPTAENLAEWFFHNINAGLPTNLQVSSLWVFESPDCCARVVDPQALTYYGGH